MPPQDNIDRLWQCLLFEILCLVSQQVALHTSGDSLTTLYLLPGYCTHYIAGCGGWRDITDSDLGLPRMLASPPVWDTICGQGAVEDKQGDDVEVHGGGGREPDLVLLEHAIMHGLFNSAKED